MAAGDINDPLSNIPAIALADNSSDPTDLGAGFALLKFKNGALVWLPHGGSVTTAMTNPMTTQDDLIVGGTSGAPARLAKGSDGQVLTVDPTTHHLVFATPASGGGGRGYLGLSSLTAGTQSHTGSTFGDIPGASVAVTATARTLMILLHLGLNRASQNGDRTEYTINRADGTTVGYGQTWWSTLGFGNAVNIVAFDTPGAGAITYKAQWRNVDTHTTYNDDAGTYSRYLAVVEV